MRIINTKACLVNRSSQRSMQNKTKQEKPKKLKSQGKSYCLCTRAGRTWNRSFPSGELRAGSAKAAGWLFPHLPWAEARSSRYAEAVGVFLFGVYIQTHPRLMYFYTYMYTHTHRPATPSWKPPAPPREAGCQPSSHCHCWKKRTVGTS